MHPQPLPSFFGRARANARPVRFTAGRLHALRWLTAALVACTTVARAAAEPFVLPKAETRALPQPAANGRDYVLYVSFPLSYDTAGPDRRYPVVYVCDGYWDFPLVASVADFVRRDGHVPETIVVGIGYGGTDPDVGLLRQWDLTPGVDTTYDAPGATTGHAAEFLNVLETEIIPFVERTYRADPSSRALVGSSFGGLFALYTAFTRPALFQGIVASSPSLWWRDEYILGLARDPATTRAGLDARMFVSWGSGDGEKIVATATRFAQEVATLGIPGLRMAARQIEGSGHAGNKPESFTRGLRYVFAPQGWVAPVGRDPGYGTLGRFANVSTRGMVEGGDRVLIGGMVVEGVLKKRVLVRAAGPALAAAGVSDALANPRLRVMNQAGGVVADNDDWEQGGDSAAVSEAAADAGAFAFAPGSRDAATIVALPPGVYTIVVDGVDGSTGVALVEAYELGP